MDDLGPPPREGDDTPEGDATLGDRLASAREAQGLTQSQLARRLGLRVETVRNWEADRSEPRANRLQMISGFLNVSMVWLMTGQGSGTAGGDLVVDGPADQGPGGELAGALAEMREVRLTQLRLVEQLGRLEKRLRALSRADED